MFKVRRTSEVHRTYLLDSYRFLFLMKMKYLYVACFFLLSILTFSVAGAQPVDPEQALADQRLAELRRMFANGGFGDAREDDPQAPLIAPKTAVSLPNLLTFASDRRGEFDIYQKEEAGETADLLLENGEAPVWSPDGRQLLFNRVLEDNFEIFLYDANGEIHNLSQSSSNEIFPSWHPDGQTILFSSDRDSSEFQLYQMDLSGNNVQPIGDATDDHAIFARFSPDGSRISYMQGGALPPSCLRNWDVWVMEADGSNQKRVTAYIGADYYPTWTPDGRDLVYARCGLSETDLYQRDPDTGEQIQLTDTFWYSEWHGVYTPDGSKLAYVSDEEGQNEIFVQSGGGVATDVATDVVNVTLNINNDSWPVWRPEVADGLFIEGQVTAFGGRPLSDVVVTTGSGETAVTNANGVYRLEGLANGDYVVTPQHDSYQFEPPNATITVPPSQFDRSFVGKDCTAATQAVPVLLVTGWTGSEANRLYTDDQLRYLIEWLGAHGYVEGCNLFYAEDTTPRQSLSDNGVILRDNLCRFYDEVVVPDSSWAGEFQIIGYSYGGLRARAYLENDDLYGHCPNSNQTISVSTLVTLGTPHGGGWPYLPFAAYIGALSVLRGDEWPAIVEMLPPTRLIQNALSSQPDGICYYAFGGDARSQWPVFLGSAALLYFTTYGAAILATPNDLAVQQESAHALSGLLLSNNYPRARAISGSELHGHIVGTEALNLLSYVYPSATVDEVVLTFLTGEANCTEQSKQTAVSATAASQARWQALEAQTVANETPTLPLIDLAAGELAEGEIVTGNFVVETAGQTAVALHWSAGDVDLTLIDPAGREIVPETVDSDAQIDYMRLDGGLGWLASYALHEASAGTWGYRINGGGLAETAVYRLVQLPPTPIGVNVSISNWLPFGNTVPITAAVTFDNSEPVAGSVVIATITQPDGSTYSLTLLDDGQSGDGAANDGVYKGHFGPALQSGTYGVLLRAMGSHDGVAYERTTTAVFAVDSPKAHLTDHFSDDGVAGGEYYQALAVDVGVDVDQASRFTLAADLYAGDLFVAQATTEAVLSAGSQTMTLLFDGQAIRESGLDGPYTVRHLLLVDNDPLPLRVAMVEMAGETAVYEHDEFGRLWHTFLPTLSLQASRP